MNNPEKRTTVILNDFKNSGLKFGMRKGKVICIDDVSNNERGLKCNCICPLCGMSLQAKLGHGKRVRHFAHNNSKCNLLKANQTGLHILAKEILDRNSRILLPLVEVIDDSKCDVNDNALLKKIRKPIRLYEEQEFEYDEVFIEKRMDNIVPDVIIKKGNHELIIEIAVTHYVDDEKIEKIRKHSISAIEIDLSTYQNKYCESDIEEVLLRRTAEKNWIFNRLIEAEKKRLIEKNKKIISDYIQARIERDAEIIRKKNLEKQRNEAERKDIEKLVSEANYEKTIMKYRNSDSVKEFILKRKQSIFSADVGELPYYVDIPLTGEVAFKCDRRIWQSVIFEIFIYKRKKDVIRLYSTYLWVKEYNEEFPFNKKLSEEQIIPFIKNKRKVNLLYEAIKQYMWYLSIIGFIKNETGFNKNSGEEILDNVNYYVEKRTLEPPNNKNSEILKNIILEVGDSQIDVDDRIREQVRIQIIGCDYPEPSTDNSFALYIEASTHEKNKKYKDRIANKEEMKVEGYAEIIASFNKDKKSVTRDSYGYRWLYCTECGEIKNEDDMVNYQFSKGICRSCNRKPHKSSESN